MHLAFALAMLYMPKNRWVNIKIIALDSTSLAIQYIPNKMIFVSKTSSVKNGFLSQWGNSASHAMLKV